ncbi:hypothetical protein F5146DRAFT_1137223 [Armillaria mellea]|nr:hypothetical protein F5146DRAFT_1137223 [Armillaria mellea]
MTGVIPDGSIGSPVLDRVLIYDTLSFLGFFSLLAALLPAVFSKRIKRRRTWFSLILSWMVYAFSYLCLVNNQWGDEPHFGTCLFQTLLVYAAPPLVASSGLYFILDIYLELRNTIFNESEVSVVYRDTPPTVLIGHLMYRNWTVFRRYCVDKASDSRSGQVSLSTIIRIVCFTVVPLAALGLASFVAAHEMESNATWNILLASLPILASLSFGTQKDIVRAWMFCLPSRGDAKKHVELSYRHLSSSIPSPLPSPGLEEGWSSQQANVSQRSLPSHQRQNLLSIEPIQPRLLNGLAQSTILLRSTGLLLYWLVRQGVRRVLQGIGRDPLSDDSDSDYSSDRSSLWTSSSPYDVSKLEARLYYFGIRGPSRRGPKLIFRTSKDVFTAPSGPEQYSRLMQLRPVYEHHKLGEDDLWATIRSKVVKLLDQRNIQHSSVDLVRFSWVEDNEDDSGDGNDEDIENVDIKVAPYGTVVTTPVTIWVGVLPDTLTGEVAYHSSNDILDLLQKHAISDIDVAYRERWSGTSEAPNCRHRSRDYCTWPAYRWFEDAQETGNNGLLLQSNYLYSYVGTFFFREDERTSGYTYKAGPKKEVVLMGTKALTNFLRSIQGHIGILNNRVGVLEKRVTTLTARSEGGGSTAEQAASELLETQHELTKTRTAIEELKKSFVKMKKQWTRPKDRVIGHVVWAPPVSVHTAPHSYTKDVCVVKLDEKKFLQNFRSNLKASNLTVHIPGPEIDAGKFISLMYPRIDAPSNFVYPVERLLELRGILSAEEMRTPNNKDHKGDPMRYVIKRGLSTLTTIGCLTGFDSHVRRYSALGSRDSVEAAVYRYDNDSGPFSKSGDSGSIIVDAHGKFVALLTGGTGRTDSSDITFGTPMYWLWDIIKAQFSGASLCFEDDDH